LHQFCEKPLHIILKVWHFLLLRLCDKQLLLKSMANNAEKGFQIDTVLEITNSAIVLQHWQMCGNVYI